jgi:HSF-type DNA-binding
MRADETKSNNLCNFDTFTADSSQGLKSLGNGGQSSIIDEEVDRPNANLLNRESTDSKESKHPSIPLKNDDTAGQYKAETDAARVASILEEDLQYGSVNLQFPEKIMSLLDSAEESQAMWWQPEGDAFCIVPASFDHVLMKHFQGTKFESFTRKLNRW